MAFGSTYHDGWLCCPGATSLPVKQGVFQLFSDLAYQKTPRYVGSPFLRFNSSGERTGSISGLSDPIIENVVI